jgi:hypothetical protein
MGYKPLHKTPSKSKFLIGSVNQQVTKALSKQVGTSETLRPLTKFNFRKLSFPLLVNKKGKEKRIFSINLAFLKKCIK